MLNVRAVDQLGLVLSDCPEDGQAIQLRGVLLRQLGDVGTLQVCHDLFLLISKHGVKVVNFILIQIDFVGSHLLLLLAHLQLMAALLLGFVALHQGLLCVLGEEDKELFIVLLHWHFFDFLVEQIDQLLAQEGQNLLDQIINCANHLFVLAQLALPHERNSLCIKLSIAKRRHKLQDRSTSLHNFDVVVPPEDDF